MANQIEIPITDTGKRIYSLDNHWIEITCPICSGVQSLKNIVLFYYGGQESHFCCDECSMDDDYEEPVCLILDSVSNGIAKISKHPDFKGKISHFYFEKKLKKDI